MGSSKNLVKQVFKATLGEGPEYKKTAETAVRKFKHSNPIKNAKSKLSKDINRKARRAQRAISGNDEALRYYARNKNAKVTGKLDKSKSNRRTAGALALHRQRLQQRENIKTAGVVIGGAIGAGVGTKLGNHLRNRNTVENKVRRKLGLKNRK